jgi:FKBP-type peptidyl-prolyl cis-trans isomerase FkpA
MIKSMVGKSFLTLLIFAWLSFVSCHNNKNTGAPNLLSQEQVTEKLVKANKAAVELENAQIEKLIDSAGWKMIKTPTGLRYMILEHGKGSKTVTGKTVHFEYEVKLLSGDIIYSSTQNGQKEFKIGSGGVESGLEEGILLLRVGDKARLVIPSYLAHGLSGDQDKIPPKATLIYTLKLIDLK